MKKSVIIRIVLMMVLVIVTAGVNVSNYRTTAQAVVESDEKDYLKFTASGDDVTIGMQKYGNPESFVLQYSFDKKTWIDVSVDETKDIVSISKGESCYFRGKEKRNTLNSGIYDYWVFTNTGNGMVAASGNIMSLLDPIVESKSVGGHAFHCLFSDFDNLTSAPELPATTLADWCYFGMFSGCSNLTSAPELPATTLADYCYCLMFSGCSNLTSAPELPATTLAGSCYHGMFEGCSNLTSSPELPVTTLAEGCYDGEYSCAVTPQIRQTGNRLSGLAGTAYASLLA